MHTDPQLDRLRSVYEEHHAALWRAVLAWSGSRDVADEAVAEAFAQALRRADEVRDPAAWVWRAAFRIAAGELHHARRTDSPDDGLDSLAAREERLPDEALDLIAALRRLSEQQRACVVLAYIAGHRSVEVARLLGTSPAVVRVQLLRARRALRAALTEGAHEEDDDDGA